MSIEDAEQLCDNIDDGVDENNVADDESDSSTVESSDDMINFGMTNVNVGIEQELSNNAFLHGLLDDEKGQAEQDTNMNMHATESSFKGVLCDTGANRSSTMSLDQYHAYCREHLTLASLQHATIDTSKRKSINGFGESVTRTIGQTRIRIPIAGLGISRIVTFNIVDTNSPSILCLRDMEDMGLEISIQENCLLLGDRRHELEVENDLLWLRWTPEYSFYTEQELRKLHRAFGHPSAKRLAELLKRARPDENYVRKELEGIVKECGVCARHSQKPRRFKLTVGTDEYQYNHIVSIDVVDIEGRKILHVVDECTHFQAAAILVNMKTDTVWRTLLRYWSNVYLGPTDFLRVDQGYNLVSKEFKSAAETEGISVLEAPIESPQTMSHVGRYHNPLRLAYKKIIVELPGSAAADVLSMATKAVNNTVGPEGLCPTILVFGALPKPARNSLTPTQVQRAVAIENAMKEVSSIQAKTRVQFGLRYKGPVGQERDDLDKLFPGAKVLVYRNNPNLWDGPFTFIDRVGETVCIQTPRGRKIFRTTAVKPAPLSMNSSFIANSGDIFDELFAAESTDDLFSSFSGNDFSEARKKELKGLQEGKVFQVVHRSKVPKGMRVYSTGWVDTVKIKGDGTTMLKSRLVEGNFRDAAAKSVPTTSPTVLRWAQRVMMCIAAMCS